MDENHIEKALPANMNFNYKLAIKALVVHDAPFQDVCLGCGIYEEAELDILKLFLAQFDYKVLTK